MKTLCYLFLFSTILLVACQVETDSLIPSDTNSIQLPGNRTLSYMEYGPADGNPVLYFHGFPTSHQEIHLFKGAELAEKYNLRIIAVDRPGYGNSGSFPGRTLTDWPDDIQHLVTSLGLDRYSILAGSGGGPFALACAYEQQEGLDKVVIVSGMGPVHAPEAKKGTAMLIPKAPKLILKGMSKMIVKKPAKFKAKMRKGLPEVDQAILDQPEANMAMILSFQEAFSSGYQGAYEDALIYKKEWGFELSDIDTKVFLWHGEKDENVKIETARFVADQLPNCQWEEKSEEGHLSLVYKYADEIFLQISGN
jgi:pimeloyl-ACP methyl ester carboxylesterase